MPDDGAEFESYTVISIESLRAYENKYCLQVYLDNFAYEIVNTQMIDYHDDNLFESDINYSYKCCIMIELVYIKKLILLKIKTVKNV